MSNYISMTCHELGLNYTKPANQRRKPDWSNMSDKEICEAKRQYLTEEQAREASFKHRQRFYRCMVCRKFHLTNRRIKAN